MFEKLKKIEMEALTSLSQVSSNEDLEKWRIINLSRSSAIMTIFSQMGTLSKEERPLFGQQANVTKQTLEQAFTKRRENLKNEELERSLASEVLDVTLPGRPVRKGGYHPATISLRRILRILADMGFQTFTSPDVETDEINFQALNFPPHHPAREMQDSIYIEAQGREENPLLLRTHTSPGQIHAMRKFSSKDPLNPPSLRIALPGMCYRYEQITARSEVQFYQVEGIAVGKNITYGDLKGTLADFSRRMFGESARVRFRASYFPFTEPSTEMDMECFVCGGKGCPVCKNSGWLEILGSGMVHPVVLQNGGYDPEVYSGFAFGMGPQRQTMLLHRMNDIRYFWGNDIRFLEQF